MIAKLPSARLDALWTVDVGDYPTALAWLPNGKQLAVGAAAFQLVGDAWRLQHAVARPEGHAPLALVPEGDLALEDIDELEGQAVAMPVMKEYPVGPG